MSKFQISEASSPGNIRLVSTNDLAQLLNCKPQTIRKWLCQDQLPSGLVRPKKINKKNYWLWDDVQSYIHTLFAPEEKR